MSYTNNTISDIIDFEEVSWRDISMAFIGFSISLFIVFVIVSTTCCLYICMEYFIPKLKNSHILSNLSQIGCRRKTQNRIVIYGDSEDIDVSLTQSDVMSENDYSILHSNTNSYKDRLRDIVPSDSSNLIPISLPYNVTPSPSPNIETISVSESRRFSYAFLGLERPLAATQTVKNKIFGFFGIHNSSDARV